MRSTCLVVGALVFLAFGGTGHAQKTRVKQRASALQKAPKPNRLMRKRPPLGSAARGLFRRKLNEQRSNRKFERKIATLRRLLNSPEYVAVKQALRHEVKDSSILKNLRASAGVKLVEVHKPGQPSVEVWLTGNGKLVAAENHRFRTGKLVDRPHFITPQEMHGLESWGVTVPMIISGLKAAAAKVAKDGKVEFRYLWSTRAIIPTPRDH